MDSELVYEFDLAVYRLSAVKKAVYRFTGRFNITLEDISQSKVRVRLAPRPASMAGPEPNDLLNEVLDQELREVVAEETKSIRELLLAQAFSGLALTDPVGETADFHDDPLGIAFPSRGIDTERQ